MQRDHGVGCHPCHEIIEIGCQQLTLPGGTQLGGHPAEVHVALHQVDLALLIGHAQGGLHPGHAPAHHQGAFGDGQGHLVEGSGVAGLGHGHTHQVFGFLGGLFRFVHVDPGVLIADVGHLKEVLVQTGLADGFLEKRLVGSW